MKKMIFIFTSLLLLFGCSPTEKDPNELIVGTNALYYPFEFKENGELKGFDIELAHLFGKTLDKKVTLIDMDFDALIISLKQNKIDMIMAGMSITPERENAIIMVPYQGKGSEQLYLAYLNQTPLEKDLSDPSIKIAAATGTYEAKYFKDNYANIELKTLDNYADMMLELKAGKIDAILLEPHNFNGLKRKNTDLAYISFDVPEDKRGKGNGIGIKKGNDALAKTIKNALETLKASGEYQSLEAKWFQESDDE